MHDAKTHLSRLVAAVEAGDVDEVEIARAGHVVARLVPPRARPARRPGSWAGKVRIGADFEELPEELTAAFRSETP